MAFVRKDINTVSTFTTGLVTEVIETPSFSLWENLSDPNSFLWNIGAGWKVSIDSSTRDLKYKYNNVDIVTFGTEGYNINVLDIGKKSSLPSTTGYNIGAIINVSDLPNSIASPYVLTSTDPAGDGTYEKFWKRILFDGWTDRGMGNASLSITGNAGTATDLKDGEVLSVAKGGTGVTDSSLFLNSEAVIDFNYGPTIGAYQDGDTLRVKTSTESYIPNQGEYALYGPTGMEGRNTAELLTDLGNAGMIDHVYGTVENAGMNRYEAGFVPHGSLTNPEGRFLQQDGSWVVINGVTTASVFDALAGHPGGTFFGGEYSVTIGSATEGITFPGITTFAKSVSIDGDLYLRDKTENFESAPPVLVLASNDYFLNSLNGAGIELGTYASQAGVPIQWIYDEPSNSWYTNANIKIEGSSAFYMGSTNKSDYWDAKQEALTSNQVIDWTASSAGSIHSSNLPAIAITDVRTVANESLMVGALTDPSNPPQEGDVFIVTGTSKTFIRNDNSAGDITDFTEMIAPGQVTSVDGATGAVTTLQLGTTSTTALAGDTTTISSDQATAITTNTSNISTNTSNIALKAPLADPDFTGEADFVGLRVDGGDDTAKIHFGPSDNNNFFYADWSGTDGIGFKINDTTVFEVSPSYTIFNNDLILMDGANITDQGMHDRFKFTDAGSTEIKDESGSTTIEVTTDQKVIITKELEIVHNASAPKISQQDKTNDDGANLTFHAQSGTGGINKSGGDLVFEAGQSTGSAWGGDIVFKSSGNTSSGSATNAYVTGLQYTSATASLNVYDVDNDTQSGQLRVGAADAAGYGYTKFGKGFITNVGGTENDNEEFALNVPSNGIIQFQEAGNNQFQFDFSDTIPQIRTGLSEIIEIYPTKSVTYGSDIRFLANRSLGVNEDHYGSIVCEPLLTQFTIRSKDDYKLSLEAPGDTILSLKAATIQFKNDTRTLGNYINPVIAAMVFR